MAQLLPNNFASYKLSTDEEEAGSVLNLNQRMVLQNKLSEIATQKINEVYDPLKPLIFVQQIGYLQGQLDLINWLLQLSEETEAILTARLQQKQSDSSNQ